ncbi:MAG: glycosyltransferase family 2 protein [Candidatus Bathyarchaeia archaeon]
MTSYSISFEPFVSVIIPTLNEEKYIGKCLESLANQTYPKNKFEVLVIDGLSTDNTLNIAKGFRDKIYLRILKNPRVKHVFALNEGIRRARGDFFVVISGHSFVERDFLEKSVKTFAEVRKNEPKLAAVGGRIVMVYENSFARLVSLLFTSPFSGVSSFWYSTKASFASTVAFGFYDKKIVIKVGFFDEDMIKGQDFELNLRLYRRGYKLYYNPNIRSYYYARNNLKSFLKQTFDNGIAKGLCVRKGYIRAIWFVPSAFVIYSLFLFIEPFLRSVWPFSFAPLGVYWIANIFLSAKVAKKKIQIFLLPLMFWILHSVAGIGFVIGLLFGKKVLN